MEEEVDLAFTDVQCVRVAPAIAPGSGGEMPFCEHIVILLAQFASTLRESHIIL
jgi:hypothetical protein